MSPTLALNNFINATAAKFEVRTNFKNTHFARIEKPSYFENGFVRQVGHDFSTMAFLIGAILGVFQLRSNKQVRRINARPIVALVKDEKPFWNFPMMQQIGKAIRCVWLSIKMEIAMTILSFASNPNPAFSKFGNVRRNWAVFINFCPKTRFWRNSRSEFISHKQKTPAKLEVKPEQCVGNESGRCQSLGSLFFAAALRPQELLHGI